MTTSLPQDKGHFLGGGEETDYAVLFTACRVPGTFIAEPSDQTLFAFDRSVLAPSEDWDSWARRMNAKVGGSLGRGGSDHHRCRVAPPVVAPFVLDLYASSSLTSLTFREAMTQAVGSPPIGFPCPHAVDFRLLPPSQETVTAWLEQGAPLAFAVHAMTVMLAASGRRGTGL